MLTKYIKILKKWKSKSPIVFLVSTIVVILASFLTTIELYNNIQSTFVNTSQSEHKKKFAELSVDRNIDHFKATLGNPIITREYGLGYKEHIFKNDYFYTQAITNKQEIVILYTVVSRKSSFNPQCQPDFEKIRLVNGTLEQLDGEIVNASYNAAASGRLDIYEIYYFGRAGGSRYYIFGISEVGFIHNNTDFSSLFSADDYKRTRGGIPKFRKYAHINMCGAISPDIEDQEYNLLKKCLLEKYSDRSNCPELKIGPSHRLF